MGSPAKKGIRVFSPLPAFGFCRAYLAVVLFLVCSGLKHGVLVWDLRISRIEDSVEEGFL